MKKASAVFLIIISLASIAVALIATLSQSDAITQDKWPKTEFTKPFPKFNEGKIYAVSASADNTVFYAENVTEAHIDAYISELKQKGAVSGEKITSSSGAEFSIITDYKNIRLIIAYNGRTQRVSMIFSHAEDI